MITSALKKLLPMAALVWIACAACGSPLRLNPQLSPDSTGSTTGAADANVVTDANTAVVTPGTLKCATTTITDMNTSERLSNCTCSSANNQTCPDYTNGTDANRALWQCTTVAVSGGYAYSCECSIAGSPNTTGQTCSIYFNPANPNESANTTAPVTTCQTQATSFGYKTSCTCTDTNAEPCDFYQGNSYTTSTAAFVEVCASTLTATGVTTTCTCNQTLQNAGATCPSTFVPSSGTVTDLIR